MNQSASRKNEAGAALVTVLMVSSLLLVAVIGLLLEATVNAANVTDAVAEQQAYDAAESGIQSAINVLRENSSPNPLIDLSKSVTHQNNRIDFAKAVKLNASNTPGDTSTEARLSRWMNYNYTPNGATNPDRVTLGTETYDPNNGSAYSVTVRDPDNPQKIISVTTSAKIDNPTGVSGSSRTYGIPAINAVTITYNSNTTGNVDVSANEVGINLGNFTITKNGIGTSLTIPSTRFEIKAQMNNPLPATVILRGTIKSGEIKNNSVGDVKIVFDSPAFNLLGSIISLPVSTITPNAPNTNGGKTNITATITLSQPKRLVIRAIGYGPRGARKQIEAIVERDIFDGLIPATITLVGTTVGSVFKSGTSIDQVVNYSGRDVLSAAKIPPVGTTGGSSTSGLLSVVLGGLSCSGCTVEGNPADVSEELPDWLKSPTELNNRINEFKEIAKSSGRYFAGGQTPPNYGNNADGTGITFIDGDANLTGSGGGIMVVTGKLNLQNTFDFNGTIIVTGTQGVRRTGTGSGSLQGNLVVAPYNIADLSAGFLPPKYDVSGGAVSNILYHTSNLLFGSNRVNTIVIGIAEK
jgi:hypothetical protein